jgi:hypothetical protein
MQRSLPWERVLSSTALPAPWLALLVFTADEIVPPPGHTASAVTNPTMTGTYLVKDLLKPADATTLGPAVQSTSTDETSCRAIEVTTDVFTKVTPRLAELAYLAHVRQVNVENKTTELAATDGWFSVVIANRFPEASAEGVRNIVHLVSLEGFAPYLVDQPSWPQGIKKVRLASLASWAFTARERGGNFSGLMMNLIEGQAKGGDGLRLRLPLPAAQQSAGSAADLAKKALQQGFAALQYGTRAGDRGFAWYHGPFVPHPVAPLTGGVHPFASSAAATIYDQQTGTFDLSYATAWETGRLLALADRAYSANQQRARRAVRRIANLIRERTRWTKGHRMLAASNENDGHGLEALLDPQHVSQSFTEWLGENAAQHLPKAGLAAVAAPDTEAPVLRARAQGTAVTQVQGLLERNDVQSLLARQAAKLMRSGPLQSVAQWLGSLRLLRHVPFAHLVPHAQMLPTESIRFFYVDPNYLDALCDGAQSIGLHSSRDVLEQSAVRSVIREEAVRHGHQLRAKLTNTPMHENAQPGDPVAGVLLRSAVVSGWPGLEIKAFATSDRQRPITPVRIDILGDTDVVLALYPSVPAWIEIDEPKEGLSFGITSAMAVSLRRIQGADIGKKFDNATLASTYLRSTTRVVNIQAWQTFLASKVTPSTLWGPAAFALQMVRSPEQMIFQNGTR